MSRASKLLSRLQPINESLKKINEASIPSSDEVVDIIMSIIGIGGQWQDGVLVLQEKYPDLTIKQATDIFKKSEGITPDQAQAENDGMNEAKHSKPSGYKPVNEAAFNNSTSKAVFMFGPKNDHQYLLGYFDPLKGESESDFLDRLCKKQIGGITKSMRDNLSLEKRPG